ncbi:hypothetical protein [Streptomyces pacificus]|uniref:Uncharacterized protein n=1 Tax=Streptomyces pacificus TaxID=2705029 RepID=A0A6A0B4N9_9ACTN|nr:hypothetical protein [Streptomyces pacificus]GFH39468.1 hypothetical protein SCWH03_57360 [Streptomyces pacificus]
MTSTPTDTILRRRRLARLRWALRHPFRLLQRYGFGWFQFAVLVVPVLLTVWAAVDPTNLLRS